MRARRAVLLAGGMIPQEGRRVGAPSSPGAGGVDAVRV